MNYKNLSFQEKELAILREAVDKNQKIIGRKMIDNPDINRMIHIVEQFLKKTKRICYGGTAINNILPVEDQFYDKKCLCIYFGFCQFFTDFGSRGPFWRNNSKLRGPLKTKRRPCLDFGSIERTSKNIVKIFKVL